MKWAVESDTPSAATDSFSPYHRNPRIGMVLQLVRNPSMFMDRKVGQPTLRWEILTVLVIGALGAVGLAYVGRLVLSDYNASEILRFPVMGLVLTPVLGGLVLWLGYSLGIHLLANRVYNARSPLQRALKATPWAMLPLGLANLVRSAVLYVVVQDIDIEAVIAEGDTFGLLDPLTLVMEAVMTEPLYLIAPVVMLLATLLTGYLLVYAVQSAKDLTRDEATRVVAVLVGVHVVYVLWELAQVYGLL